MEQVIIRTLRADEIECRVGSISEKGVSLLLYKDARCDMRILDEVYGPTNWQRSHELIGGNLYCKVSIWDDEKKQWISKMDVGTKSYSESEKGEASDSFKRACVSLGIGRELYTAPFIWINVPDVTIVKKQDNMKKEDKLVTYDKFTVQSIEYNDNREITGLTIVNQKGKTVYQMRSKAAEIVPISKEEAPDNAIKTSTKLSEEYLQALYKELDRTGVGIDTVLMRYGIERIEDMDMEIYKKAMNSLRRSKAKAA